MKEKLCLNFQMLRGLHNQTGFGVISNLYFGKTRNFVFACQERISSGSKTDRAKS